MTETRPSVRRPVVLDGVARRRRRRAHDGLLGAEALDASVPGRILVLLSRLHRSEGVRPDATGDGGA